MPIPLATIGTGLAIGSSLINIGRTLFGQPNVPNERDVNREFDLRLNRGLRDIAQTVRRQLVGAGQEGSGTISTAITDAQNKFRARIEEERVRALELARRGKFQALEGRFDRGTQLFGDLAGIGFAASQLNKPGLQVEGLSPLLTSGDILNQGANNQFVAPQSNPFQNPGLQLGIR